MEKEDIVVSVSEPVLNSGNSEKTTLSHLILVRQMLKEYRYEW